MAFFSCGRGVMEGDTVLLPAAGRRDVWVVLKSRDVGEPAPRLCEAELRRDGRSQLLRSVAGAIWASLPGAARWSSFDASRPLTKPCAKLHQPMASKNEACAFAPWNATSACASLLFVAHGPNASGPLRRRPYLGKIRRREREDIRTWYRSANASQTGEPTCPDEIASRSTPPRIYTSRGLRAALSTHVCSRACSAARLRSQMTAARDARRDEPTPCLLSDERSGCDLRGGNVFLVVSHWNADMRYLREQPYCYAVFEKRGNGQDHVIDFAVANRANEASTYLHFLMKYYDDLPETTIFLQDARSSAHNADILSVLRHLRLDNASYMPLNSVHMPFLSAPAFCHLERCMHDTGLRHLLPQWELPRHQMDVAYTCCAQFLVTRSAVQARPRALYEALYRYTLGASDFGHRGDSFARGECLEVMWHVIFGRPRIDAPVAPSTLCGDAAAAQCTTPKGFNGFVPLDDPFWSWAKPLWDSSRVEERAEMRAGRLTPFDAGVRRRVLCPDGGSKACELPLSGIPEPSLEPRLQRELVTTRVTTPQGTSQQMLSSNCSLIEAQSEAGVARRKLTSTLRQTCGGRPAGKQRGAEMLELPERALCTLYQKQHRALRAPSI